MDGRRREASAFGRCWGGALSGDGRGRQRSAGIGLHDSEGVGRCREGLAGVGMCRGHWTVLGGRSRLSGSAPSTLLAAC